MLDVTGLNVTFEGIGPYEGTAAVADVSFTVAKGEVVAILGPSGSGKSTLLRAVAGLQRPDTGRITMDGDDVTPTAPHDRGIGFMFQAPTLFPHRDVAGNVGFGLRMLGLGGDAVARRVAELLDLVGLPGMQERAVSTLSGGEQQRVALARALAPEPRLLLLDEPFGALDAVLRQRLVEDVGWLVHRLGLTVVAVTHDREEAYALADRVLVMHDGQIVADGTPEQLWSAPGSAWVARFLGMPNVLVADVHDGVARTTWGDLTVDPSARGSYVVVPTASVHVGDPSSAPAAAGTGTAGTRTAAQVVSRVFLGDRVRLLLRAAADSAAGPTAAELVATVPVGAAPMIDSVVAVTIAPANLLVLP